MSTLSTPFIKMPKWMPRAVLAYFMVYGVFLNLYLFIIGPDHSFALFSIVVLRIINQLLLILPIVLPFRNIGILHPLAFSFLFSIAKKIVKDPTEFFWAFLGDKVPISDSSLLNFGSSELLSLNVQSEFYALLWTVALYVGYFSTKGALIKLKSGVTNVSHDYYRVAAVVGICIFLGFLITQGGITSWITSWGSGGGRRNAIEDIGPVIRLLTILYFIPLTWYLIKGRSALRKPLFIVSAILFLMAGFIASGSRSALLDVLIAYILVLLIRGSKLPYKTLLLSGAGFYLLFGLLGMVRTASTYSGGDFSWSDIELNTSTVLEESASEIEMRSSFGSEIVIYDQVPNDIDFLYGKTYVAALAFFVPRFIWEDKPHGVGYYVGHDIFGQNSGIPAAPHAEAYWNFGIPGILLIAFLNGMLIRFVVKMYMRYYQTNPGWVVVHIIIITSTIAISSLGLTELFQRLLFVVLGLKLLKQL